MVGFLSSEVTLWAEQQPWIDSLLHIRLGRPRLVATATASASASTAAAAPSDGHSQSGASPRDQVDDGEEVGI
jgi:hypothetical protein